MNTNPTTVQGIKFTPVAGGTQAAAPRKKIGKFMYLTIELGHLRAIKYVAAGAITPRGKK